MNHIFINTENIQMLIHRLIASDSFQDGTFTLYQDVAIKHLDYSARYFTRRHNLSTMNAKTADQSIDFLVCRQSEAVLGITFDIDERASTELFHTVLHGLPHYSVNLLSFISEDITDTLWQILQLLSDMVDEGGPISPFSLHVCQAQPMPCMEELVSKRLVDTEGFANIYGRDCGLVFKVTLRGCTPCIALNSRDAFLQTINWSPVFPAAESPSNLQALLDIPIEDLFSANLQFLDSLPFPLYGKTLHDFILSARQHLDSIPDETTDEGRYARECIHQLLQATAKALCEHGAAQNDSVLRISLKQYYDEAALLTGCHYVLWKYRHNILPFLNPNRAAEDFTLTDALHHALNKDAIPSLYELLFLPLLRKHSFRAP